MRFNEKTTTQLAAYFLKKRNGQMSYMKLIKLLYLADRKCIEKKGSSLTKDTYFSMKNGPVLSNVFDLIHSDPYPNRISYWENFISDPTPQREVFLKEEPEYTALSANAREIADEVFEEYGNLNRWQICDFSHTLPEYVPLEEGREKITFRDIAKALGMDENEIANREEEARNNSFVHSTLGV